MTIQKKHWPKIELLIFTVVTLANLLPFISTKFFPSLDGASHLSNANIINQLLVYHNDLFQQFFRINPEPVPNWTSHLLLSLLGLILPAFLSEKIIIAGLLLGLPFAFRGLIKTMNPENISISYLVFPFTHSMFLFFGFFNFCFGVIFFLIALNFYLRRHGKIQNWKDFLILISLILVTYFSHILVFGILLILIATHIISTGISEWISKKIDLKQIIKEFFNKTLVLSLASAIPLSLFVYFFISRPGTRDISFIPKSQLLEYLIRLRPLISFNAQKEGLITLFLFILLIILVIIGLLILFYRFVRKADSKPEHPHSKWLIPSILILLLLYFTLPDAFGTASYTNLRINYLLFLLIILWIATFPLPRWTGILAATFAMVINIIMIRYDKPIMRDLNQIAISANKAADFIPANSLVLPINVLDNWFTGHFVDYIAIDKPILMVYNYECVTEYFPVRWNASSKPNYYIGNPSDTAHYLNFELIKDRKSLKINYIFVLGKYDPAKDWFFSTLDKILKSEYIAVYTADFCSLYQTKAR